MPSRKEDEKPILIREMKKALQRSGYLLEQRVELIIKGAFGYVETNWTAPL
jgi:hypothetical protein